MKKSLLILLLPFSVFADDVYDFLAFSNSVCSITLGKYLGTTLNESTYSSSFANLRLRLLREKVGVRFYPSSKIIGVPNLNFTGNSPSTSFPQYTTRPVSCTYNGINYSFHWRYFDDLTSLYLALQAALNAGYDSSVLDVQAIGSDSSKYINVCFGDFIFDVLTGTNTLFRSIVVNSLATVNSSLSNLQFGIDSLSSSVSGVSSNVNNLALSFKQANYYSSLSFSDLLESAIESEIIDPYKADEIQNRYDSFSSNPSQQANFAASVRDMLSAARSLSSFLSNSNLVDDVGRSLNNSLNDSINSGVAGAAHFHGATTNLLQRITNNTEQIKNDLQAWRIDSTNRLDRQWEVIKKVRDNTGDTAAGVAHIVNDGVKINGPVQFVLGTDFLGVDLNAGDITELIRGFADGSDAAMQKWLREWDRFKDSQLPYMARFSSFIESNTNILSSIDSKLDLSYTNVFSLIYNQLTNNVSSNNISALLLDDYETFIDSSKYSSLVSSLPGDLAAALSSFGFADSSEYSGRWWVFQSANLALQSQLALTNAALSSTLLHALSVIDDSDDSGGSLLSRWLSLIDSIPDPEEIQQSLSDATNIVSNIGFERADVLYATATQDLVSVVKGIYQDKSLPDNIRFVFIPAADGRDEKYVDIPVGEHSSLWSLFRSGMAFALSVVTLILFPKYVSWLVAHYTRLVERIIKSLHAYTHQ